jgi:peptide/nickel transport system substrate-binding protein
MTNPTPPRRRGRSYPSAALGLALVAAAAAGCSKLRGDAGAAAADPKAGRGRPVTLGAAIEPGGLNPLLDLNDQGRQIVSLVFDGLTDPAALSGDLRQEYVLALATAIREIDPKDRTKLSIELKPGVKWHNGADFTSADVVFTWKAIHSSRSPLATRLDRYVDALSEDGPHGLRVHLREEKIADRVQDILSFKIIPKKVDPTQGTAGELPEDLRTGTTVVNKFTWKPIGTGPYRIEDRPSASEIVLAATPLAVLGTAKVKSLRFKRFPGWDQVARSLVDKSSDLVIDVAPNYFAQLDREGLAKQTYIPHAFYALVYNVAAPPLDKRELRRALALATDRAQLAASFLPDASSVDEYLNQSIYPHNYEHVRAHPSDYKTRYQFNRDAAKAALASARVSRPRLSLLICSYLQGESAKALANAYKEAMATIGVDVTVEDAPNMGRYNTALRERRFQVAFVLYDGFDHLYDMFDVLERGGARNFAGFSSSDLASRLSQLKLTLAYDEVGKLTREIHQLVDDNVPLTPLFTLPRRAYHAPGLQGLALNPGTYLDMFYQTELR